MGANVRRLAPPRREPKLEIMVSEAAECIAALSMVARRDVRCDDYDIGCDWFERTRTMMSPALRDLLAPLLSSPATVSAWHALLGVLAEASPTLPALFEHVAAMPAGEL